MLEYGPYKTIQTPVLFVTIFMKQS